MFSRIKIHGYILFLDVTISRNFFYQTELGLYLKFECYTKKSWLIYVMKTF